LDKGLASLLLVKEADDGVHNHPGEYIKRATGDSNQRRLNVKIL
jgi:hypothetical protein